MSVFDKSFGFVNLGKDSILIGHSLGAPFILHLLERANSEVYACFFVAGFLRELNLLKFDKLNKSFLILPFDWDTICSKVKHSFVYHSDNDPYVPLELGQELAEKLKTELTLIPSAGHINAEFGYTKFPKILDDIKRLSCS